MHLNFEDMDSIQDPPSEKTPVSNPKVDSAYDCFNLAVHSSDQLARSMTSPDKGTRDKAFYLLARWLSSHKDVKDADMSKIWQGLFYCIWHADKEAPELIEKICTLLSKLEPQISCTCFKVLLLTIRGGSSGIDKKRMGKFNNLLKSCLGQMLRTLQASFWDVELVTSFVCALSEGCFLANDQAVGKGVDIYLVQIFLDEIYKFLPFSEEILQLFLEPFFIAFTAAESKGSKQFLGVVRDAIFLRLHQEIRATLINSENHLTTNLGSLLLKLPIAAKLLEVANQQETGSTSKKMLLALHEEFNHPEKCLQKSSSPKNSNKRKKGKLTTGCDTSEWPSKKRRLNSLGKNESLHTVARLALEQEIELCTDATFPESELLPKVLDETLTDGKANIGNPGIKSSAFISSSNADNVNFSKVKILSCNSPVGKVLDENACKSLDTSSLMCFDTGINENESGEEGVQVRVLDGSDPVVMNLEDKFVNLTASDMALDLTTDVSCRNSESFALHKEPTLLGTVDEDANVHTAKRVTFSLKSNLVWKPHLPLPPQWIRVPPSATPKGSALKKGVLPGPISTVVLKKTQKRPKKRVSTGLQKSPRVSTGLQNYPNGKGRKRILKGSKKRKSL